MVGEINLKSPTPHLSCYDERQYNMLEKITLFLCETLDTFFEEVKRSLPDFLKNIDPLADASG